MVSDTPEPKMSNTEIHSLNNSVWDRTKASNSLVRRGLEFNDSRLSVDEGKPEFHFIRALQSIHDKVFSLVLSRNNRWLVAAGNKCAIEKWDLTTGELAGNFRGHQSEVYKVAISLDNRTLYSAGWDKTIRGWDLVTNESLFTLRGHQQAVHDFAISPDGSIGVSAGIDGSLLIWNSLTGITIDELPRQSKPIVAIQFLSNTQFLTGDLDGRIRILETGTQQVKCEYRIEKNWLACLAKPEDRPIIICGGRGSDLAIINQMDGSQIKLTNAHNKGVRGIAYLSRLNSFLSAGEDGAVYLWQDDSQVKKTIIKPNRHACWSIQTSWGEDWCAVGVEGGHIGLFNIL